MLNSQILNFSFTPTLLGRAEYGLGDRRLLCVCLLSGTETIVCHYKRPTSPALSLLCSCQSTIYKNSPRWEQCILAMFRYPGKDMMPFHTVEKQSFTTFDKQYELPGWKFSKTAIPDLYNKVKADSEVKSYKQQILLLLITDMWSTPNMVPYMSVTAHYVTL